jgi:translation initiation factor 2 subunit 2
MDGDLAVEHPRERKARKSVAFTDEQVIVDADGSVTMVAATDDSHPTALSHTPRTPPLTAALEAFNDPASHDDGAADDGGLDLTMKKKKKKPKAAKEDGEEGAGEDAAAGPADEGGLDLTIKKKKKKKVVKEDEADEFAAKLKALDLDKEGGGEAAATAAADEEGDIDAGTGVWSHDDSRPIAYELLLKRFYKQLEEKNPDHALSGTKSYKIPPPQCMREGNKKTIFANIAEICKRMKRTEEHVTAYLFAELGTSGSVDGSRRLVIKGRFQQKQIENVLRKYIIEYVTCKTCKSPDTELNKGENRLYFITCNSCGSRRSVTAIKTGFSAQVGKRKKMQG